MEVPALMMTRLQERRSARLPIIILIRCARLHSMTRLHFQASNLHRRNDIAASSSGESDASAAWNNVEPPHDREMEMVGSSKAPSHHVESHHGLMMMAGVATRKSRCESANSLGVVSLTADDSAHQTDRYRIA